MFSGVFAVEKAQLARLHYSGGGDWYNDQDIIPNLTEYLNKTLNTDFSNLEAAVKLTDSNIYDYPFLFATGHGNIKFNEKEVASLQEYLTRGGFLYVDDDYGMDKSFRAEVKKLFPNRELVELPANHELFNCFFNFESGIPKIHKHDDKRPQAFAVFDDNGRMLLLYTYETNISDGWSKAHDDPPEIREKAFQMGANLFYYLLTN
ncbi:MAG: DUF4159 domain-containing protein [Candidatus Cloacimonetes bacterium]|nr:DUF4159 domain-containing protein [Candidatus Cloacimonadota bacterium]MCF7815127.1 DUF4159 domain-containing protein [Candidatus Cloacimonadota bacterium]MCF7869356.1 DUF4159 domain-containing protein [Candidatus Cloacimonadota bacterium]MCF7884751.1 DUF4159 domain-containing protein [Candidatus Cloacimonadota bacterium]